MLQTRGPRQMSDDLVDHFAGRRDWLCVLVLLVTLSALVPLAEASPPDPLWIAGIYDSADHDEVIGLVTSAAAAAEPWTGGDVGFLAILIASVAHGRAGCARTADRSPASVRAPPAF